MEQTWQLSQHGLARDAAELTLVLVQQGANAIGSDMTKTRIIGIPVDRSLATAGGKADASAAARPHQPTSISLLCIEMLTL